MARKRTLNGLPHNVTKSFFGSMRYYEKGYMGDWLLNLARKRNVRKGSLNIMTGEFQPEEFNIHPLVVHAKTLHAIIEKELLANGFPPDFIVTAVIDIQFPDPVKYRKTLYCFPYMIDRDGKRYAPGRIIEHGYEPEFDALDTSFYLPRDPFNISLEKIPAGRRWRWSIRWRKIKNVLKRIFSSNH